MADLRNSISSPYLCNCPPLKNVEKGGDRGIWQLYGMLWTMNTELANRPTPMAETSSRFIGRSVKPHKTSRFLTGGGVYVSDIRLPNMLHAALVRSIHAHARIRSIEVEQALRLDGVFGAWTGNDIKDQSPSSQRASRSIRARGWKA